MDSFDSLCWCLAILYGLLALIALIQIVRIIIKENDDINQYNIVNIIQLIVFPSTIQLQIHTLAFLLCVIRMSFFIVSLDAWDPYNGHLKTEKLSFYSLDELASVLFFSITSILGLFWAELYYISTQQGIIFTRYVKPIIYSLNIIAFIGIIICILYIKQSYTKDIDYIYVQYTILIATLYILSAIMFGYYAKAAASELKNIPVILSARRDRLRLLWSIAVICVVSLLVKSIIIIYVTGSAISMNSRAMLGAMFCYYFLFELTPLCIVLLFYRVESNSMSRSQSLSRLPVNEGSAGGKEQDNYDEYSALDPSNSNSNNNRTFPKDTFSSDDVVDAVIARLSLDV